MTIKYGKPSGPLLRQKQNFLNENESLLKNVNRLSQLYALQPARTKCKNCDSPNGSPDFTKNDIPYSLCRICGHLNGHHEDTDAFCEGVYTESGDGDYARNYATADKNSYASRMREIYSPKAEFLIEALADDKINSQQMKFADFGAGSGYFVAALLNAGVQNVSGYEVSNTQVDHANKMLESPHIIKHELVDTVKLAGNIDADIVSMIGVLEHVQKPREILNALIKNSAVKYLFLSVPLFSPCIFFEMIFPTVFSRQLSAGHTHLYTEKSLDWLCNEFGFEKSAEWWFGTDMVDLYRNIRVRLEQLSTPENTLSAWDDMMLPTLDAMQLALDKRHIASEVHMLLKKI